MEFHSFCDLIFPFFEHIVSNNAAINYELCVEIGHHAMKYDVADWDLFFTTNTEHPLCAENLSVNIHNRLKKDPNRTFVIKANRQKFQMC